MNDFRLTLRFVGLAFGLMVGLTFGNVLSLLNDSKDTRTAIFALGIAIGGIGYLLGPHLSWRLIRDTKRRIAEASTLDLVAVAIGLGFGAIVAAPLALPLSFLPDPAGRFLPLVVAIAACALSTAVVVMRKADLVAPWFRARRSRPIATVTEAAVATSRPLLLDTNVVIDGRIDDVMKTGFIEARLQIPRFVLDELQHIADAEDPLRRARGRRGLETLKRLREEFPRQIDVLDDRVPEEREVDAELVRLARSCGARVLTNDYNLNKVAQVQGVTVLNLNELTNALRPRVLPGEEISLKVVQEGREAGQGVGFLDDGTMVVVDGGRPLVGKQASVTVTRMLQTGVGRMVFATPKHANP